jgi:2-methylcitrate dehydratase
VYHWPKAGGAHPSDVIMPLLAVAESEHSSGRDLITAIVLAYEIYLCMANSVRTPGFDFINNQSLAVAIAAGKLMRLSNEEMAQCISLVVVPNNALGQARSGHLSHWKAAASGQAGRAGVFAAMLAREGMQGAVTPFEGRAGWSAVVAGGPITLAPMAGEPGASHFRILDTIIKPRSSCATTLSSILAAEKAGQFLDGAKAIDKITVEVYARAVHLGEGEHSFNPDTRESADHSIPYVVAAALMDGTVTPRSFLETRLWDPELRALVQKVKVVHNPAFTEDYEKLPVEHRTRVTVATKAGAEHVGEIRTLKGAPIDPMDDSEIEDKFRMLTQEYFGGKRARAILDRLWAVEDVSDVGEIPPVFAL